MITETDNRLAWVKSNGDALNHGIAAANGAKYYAEIPLGRAKEFTVTLDVDGTEASANTLESSIDPSASIYAATGAGWTSQAVALGTKTAAAAIALLEWQIVNAVARRWRIKRDVTTGGVVTARADVKGA